MAIPMSIKWLCERCFGRACEFTDDGRGLAHCPLCKGTGGKTFELSGTAALDVQLALARHLARQRAAGENLARTQGARP